MDDERAKAIKDLEDIINIYERHKKQGSITRALVLDTEIVESLKFALESIKVDRVYELMHEKVDFIEIPEGATFGDMMKAVFPNMEFKECIEYWTGYDGNTEGILVKDIVIDKKLWNSPYRKENNNG